MFKLVHVNAHQIGLRFKNDALLAALPPGWYFVNRLLGERIDVLSERDLHVTHPALDDLVRSPLLDEFIEKIDLADNERALVWADGRFACALAPGRYAFWKRLRRLTIERLIIEQPRFEHRELVRIVRQPGSDNVLTTVEVAPGENNLYFRNGRFVEVLGPGLHAFWKNVSTLTFHASDLREKMLDMTGQEIITADKVSVRLNAVVTYRIVDALTTFQIAACPDESLYRDGQLILRAAVGRRKLDEILADKESLAREIETELAARAGKFGLTVMNFGIRDLILPGDMRDLMNQVVEAQKRAEAIQITRREETAATRSQCNTAKMIEGNPTLMRLRELEVIERIAEKSKMNLILGEKSLTEKVVNML